METFENIQAKRDEIFKKGISLINAAVFRKEGLEEAVQSALENIISECGDVSGYLFTFCITDLTGSFGNTLSGPFEKIFRTYFKEEYKFLGDYEPCFERKLSFAAFYALMTFFIDSGKMEETKRIFSDVDGFGKLNYYFNDFALYHDILSRYYKRTDGGKDFYLALDENGIAIEHLDRKGISNAGVYCSFASTVCKMMENGISVRNRDKETAADCIRKALEFNPGYAKYHYINALLIYYRSKSIESVRNRIDELNRAYDETETAIRVEDLARIDVAQRVAMYRAFRQRLQVELDGLDNFKDDTAALNEIDEWKRNICESQDEDHCQRPALIEDSENYIFICYSRTDYKKVFCDLVELYFHGIPFRYDKGGETVKIGADWEESVRFKMLDSRCLGVIFYMSENTLLSESLEREEKAILEKAGDRDLSRVMFCVNPTKKKASQLIVDTIRRHSQEELDRYHVDSERLITFLKIFNDKRDYIARDPEPENTSHIADLLKAINDNFGIKARNN